MNTHAGLVLDYFCMRLRASAFALLAALVAVPALAQVQTITCPEGFDVLVAPVPALPLKSLKTVPNPVLPNGPTGAPRTDLVEYIANQTAAIQLGKALFWDMQVGSDSKPATATAPATGTACATCHFQAGADTRTRNQLNPGANGLWDSAGADYTLQSSNFPFSTPTTDNTDNIAASQGVSASIFVSIDRTTGAETTTAVNDPVFGNFRRTTGLNAPSTINAVFNHRNFFNGRAQPDFNGVNPFGSRDINAQVWALNNLGTPARVFIHVDNASLASQAVGPPLSPVEMSADGRTFPDLGRKMLRLKPLGLQKVDARDSVLGKLAEPRVKGLNTTYTALIQQAFQPKWWNSTQNVYPLPSPRDTEPFTLMEANFSLYWGLAIMLYEATLVSNDSPMDQFLDTRLFNADGTLKKEGSSIKLSTIAKRLQADYGYTGGATGILNGLRLFEKPLPPAPSPTTPTGRDCIACHLGANTTSASVANLVQGGIEPGDAAFKAGGFDLRMERMFMQIPGVPTDLISMSKFLAPQFFTDQITFDPSAYAVTVTEQRITGGVIASSVPAPVAAYDAGWYNVGAEPSSNSAILANHNPGVGGTDPNGKPLSWVGYLQQTLPDPSIVKVPGGTLGCASPTYSPGPTPPLLTDALGNPLFPNQVLNASGFPLLSGPLARAEQSDAIGSFKTSQLRNVELNGPYFHNGGKSTLKQVVDFYDDGADFPKVGDSARGAAFPADRRSPIVKFYGDLTANSLGMTAAEVNDMVAFLVALTDDRVRFDKAPFDHPELVIPNGNGNGTPRIIPAVGAAGSATPLTPFLGLNPFTP